MRTYLVRSNGIYVKIQADEIEEITSLDFYIDYKNVASFNDYDFWIDLTGATFDIKNSQEFTQECDCEDDEEEEKVEVSLEGQKVIQELIRSFHQSCCKK